MTDAVLEVTLVPFALARATAVMPADPRKSAYPVALVRATAVTEAVPGFLA